MKENINHKFKGDMPFEESKTDQNEINSKFSNNVNSNNKKSELIDDIDQLVKCYICLDKNKKPKMCVNCHHLVCGKCIEKWFEIKNICPNCKKQESFIDIPFMGKFNYLVDSYKNLEENKILAQKIKHTSCKKHNEKALYYCFNCNEKLCGKCSAFNNEEARIHEKHRINIFEYSDIEKIGYNMIINLKDDIYEYLSLVHYYIQKCQKKYGKFIEKENKIPFNNGEIQKIFLDKKNKKLKFLNILDGIKNGFEKQYKNIYDKLKVIKSLDKPVSELFNFEEEKKNFEKYKEELVEKETKIIKDNNENFLEMISDVFIFNNTYESIEKDKNIKKQISGPYPFIINISSNCINNEIEIKVYISYEASQTKNLKIKIIPFLQINNGDLKEMIKEKKIKDNDIGIKDNDIDIKENNIKDKNDNIIIGNESNNNDEYKLLVKINELIKGDNKFYIFIYYYSF